MTGDTLFQTRWKVRITRGWGSPLTFTRTLVPALTQKHTRIHMGTLEHNYTHTSNFTVHCFWLRCIFKPSRECVFVTVYHVWISLESRRWRQISQSWSYRQLWVALCRCREPNLGSLEKNSRSSQLLSHLFSPDLHVLIHLLSAINCLGRLN